MRSWFGLAVVGVSLGVLTQSCGSSSSKKAVQTPGGGASGDSGAAGEAGTPSGSGSGGISGSAGSAEAGDGGTAGSVGPQCEPGFAECDGDSSESCEQSLSLVTSCGACDVVCAATHGTAACVDQKCELTCADGFGDCDADPSTGCESTLASNDENCGACGRNCAAEGATCLVDHCSSIAMQANFVGGNDNNGNRSWAFSASGPLHMGVFDYAVTRFPLDGSPEQTIWKSMQKTSGNNSLLVVGDEVYWSEFGIGTDDFTAGVFKKKISDPAGTLKTTVFVPEWTVQFLRKQGNALYWASGDYQSGDAGGYIYTRNLAAPESDPGTKIVSENQGTHVGINALDVTSNAIYWVSQVAGTGVAKELRTVPLSGGTPTVVPEVWPNTGTPITAAIVPTLLAAGDEIYFNRTINDAQDGIYSFATGDTKPKLLVPGSGINTFIIDAEFIYYAKQNQQGLYKAPITGGAGVTIMSTGGVSRLVGQDQKFVYFIQGGSGTSSLFKAIK